MTKYKTMRWRFLRYFLFLIFPAMLLSVHIYFVKTVDDTRWAINVDPDYPYLVSAIDLSNLSMSKMVLHPGTTFQMLGGVVIKCGYLFKTRNGESIQESVLRYPTYYLNLLQGTFAMMNIMLVLLLGIFVYRITKNIAAALFIQSLPFFSAQMILFGFRKVTSDILLIAILLIFLSTMIKWLHTDFSIQTEKKNYIYAVLWGALSGFALATKITFLPVVIIPIILLPTIRSRILYLSTTTIGTLLFTLPISSQYPIFYNFLLKIFTHKGIYGNGAPSLFDFQEYMFNLSGITMDNLPFLLIWLMGVVAIIVLLIERRLQRTGQPVFGNPQAKMLGAVLLSQIVSMVLVARHFKNKYLLSALCFSTLIPYLIYLLSKEKARSGKSRFWESGKWLLPGAVLLVLFSFAFTLDGLKRFHNVQKQRLEESIAIKEKLAGEYNGYGIVYYFNAPSEIFGLTYGDHWTPAFRKTLFQIHGNHYFYDHRPRTLYSWKEGQITLGELKTRFNGRVLFFGNPFPDLQEKQHMRLPAFALKDVFGGKYYTLYRLVDE